MLATDEINAALRLIGGGTFAAGETPSDSETADAAFAFNQLLEAWSITQLAVFQIVNFAQALSAATQAYTMGTGGTFNTARPVKIQTPGMIVGGIRRDLEMVSPAKWAAIAEKGLTGVLPLKCWNDNAYPLATLRFWPIPSGTTAIFDAYLWVPFTSIVAMSGTCTTSGTAVTWVSGSKFDQTLVGVSFVLAGVTYTVASVASATALTLTGSAGVQTAVQFIASSTFALPPGYGRALRYNLALELAAEFDRAVPESVVAIAQASKAELITLNTSNALAALPSDLPTPDQAA